jgi:hypothetical protein
MTPEELEQMRADAKLLSRFWSKVKLGEPDECWEWTAGHDGRGYGQFWANGRTRRAPQVAWEIYNLTEFPKGKGACHTCDNPPCVNPSHIWPGTQKENSHDCVRKGRHVPATSPWNRGITHCKSGHEFTPANTYVTAAGYRQCQACMREFRRKWRESRRATLHHTGMTGRREGAR